MQPLPLIFVGRITDTNDPDKFGRVQAEVDAYTGKVTLPWLRILQGGASTASGAFFLPEVGDEVVILRGDGANPDGMIVLGAVYGGTDRLPQKRSAPGTAGEPPTAFEAHEEDGKNNIKQIISRAGHEILLDDTDDKGQIRISTGDGKMCITMDVEAKAVTIYGTDTIDIISADTINLKADTAINFETKDLTATTEGDITMEATGGVTMKATGDLKAEGANATVKASSAAATLQGTASVAIKGPSIKLGM